MSDKKFSVQINCNCSPEEALNELEALLGQKHFNPNEGAIIISLLVKIREGLSQTEVVTMDSPGDVPPPPPIKP